LSSRDEKLLGDLRSFINKKFEQFKPKLIHLLTNVIESIEDKKNRKITELIRLLKEKDVEI
jgi:hypothetical protein